VKFDGLATWRVGERVGSVVGKAAGSVQGALALVVLSSLEGPNPALVNGFWALVENVEEAAVDHVVKPLVGASLTRKVTDTPHSATWVSLCAFPPLPAFGGNLTGSSPTEGELANLPAQDKHGYPKNEAPEVVGQFKAAEG